MTTVEFKYGLGDRVCVKDQPRIEGRIEALMQEHGCRVYRMSYWHDGEVRSVILCEDEIDTPTHCNCAGFDVDARSEVKP